jgi:hypothetical protein
MWRRRWRWRWRWKWRWRWRWRWRWSRLPAEVCRETKAVGLGLRDRKSGAAGTPGNNFNDQRKSRVPKVYASNTSHCSLCLTLQLRRSCILNRVRHQTSDVSVSPCHWVPSVGDIQMLRGAAPGIFRVHIMPYQHARFTRTCRSL